MPDFNTNQNFTSQLQAQKRVYPRQIRFSYQFEFKEEFTRCTYLVILFISHLGSFARIITLSFQYMFK